MWSEPDENKLNLIQNCEKHFISFPNTIGRKYFYGSIWNKSFIDSKWNEWPRKEPDGTKAKYYTVIRSQRCVKVSDVGVIV